MDPFILARPRIPIFLAVHRSQYFWPIRESLYSGRSMDPYILTGPWIPIFLADRGSLYFWLVRASLYSGRSMDSFILICPEILFPRNVLSRQNPDSSSDSVWTKFVFIFRNCPDWIQIFFWTRFKSGHNLASVTEFYKFLIFRKTHVLMAKFLYALHVALLMCTTDSTTCHTTHVHYM